MKDATKKASFWSTIIDWVKETWSRVVNFFYPTEVDKDGVIEADPETGEPKRTLGIDPLQVGLGVVAIVVGGILIFKIGALNFVVLSMAACAGFLLADLLLAITGGATIQAGVTTSA